MPVTLEQVLAQLHPDEPNYQQAAHLGPDAVPHLIRLVQEGDPGLASKATYLAGFINVDQSVAVVERAAASSDPVVRVAAAGSLSRLNRISARLTNSLLQDQDAGVRYWTLKALEVHRPVGVKTNVQQIVSSDPDITLRELAQQVVSKLR